MHVHEQTPIWKTHSSAKVRTAMGAVANDAQSSLVALLLTVELATLLGRHGWSARVFFIKTVWRDLEWKVVNS
jgi:hypothetical protein